MPRLIDIELGLGGQRFEKFFAGTFKSPGGFLKKFGQVPTGNTQPQDILQQTLNARIGTVQSAFKENHKAGQSRTEKAGGTHLPGQGR